MAGMGPPPKPSALRQRRNRVTTAAQLPAQPLAEGESVIPKTLPKRGEGERAYHARTLEFWEEVRVSEMAGELIRVDVPGLYILAELVDRFWHGETTLAAEIRLERQCFGLTPLDRRRLQWEVAKVKDAERKRAPRQVEQPTVRNDPRRLLRAVK